MATILVEKKMNYGGKNVTDKYKPLGRVTYVEGDAGTYSKLATHRAKLLTDANILPQPLELRTNWPAAIAAENTAGQLPPLVVISTNRSRWIASGIRAATRQLAKVRFTVAHDLNALTDLAKVKQSPPLYAPVRIGPNRNVYIIVHLFEYQQYQTELAGLGVTVVGWFFHTPRGAPISQLAGFGASRFAAMEFCKQLRTASGNRWNYAWLMDDNVVGITSWPGFAPFETVIAAKPTNLCVGFSACVKVEPQSEIAGWAGREVDAGRAIHTTVPTQTTKGLVQQASLWNIRVLTEKHLNFGPAFINSAEDVSFSKYMDLAPLPYIFCGSPKVMKEETKEDNSAGAARVKAAREAYTRWVVNAESAGTVTAESPPPVMVKLSTTDPDKTISTFITNWFTSVGGEVPPPDVAEVTTEVVQQKAMCQAVEQIIVEACEKGFVNKGALTANLKVNGSNAQEVARVNL